MRKLIAVISSLLFISLGITACSKDGSKKQPNFRNRHQGKVTQQTPQQEAERLNPDQNKPEDGDDSRTRPVTIGPVTLKTDTLCLLQVEKKTEAQADACNSVLVAKIGDTIEALSATDGALYNQIGEQEVKAEDIETLENGNIVAKLSSKQVIKRRNIKVLQIMKDDEKVTVPADMQFQAEPIATDEDQTDLRDKVKDIKIQDGDHLVVLTNIDALKGNINAIQSDILANNTATQTNLNFYDSEKLEEALVVEEAIINSYIAQLSVAIPNIEVDQYKALEAAVKVNDVELLHDQVQILENTSTNRVSIQILNLDNFVGPEYEIVVEIEKK